ncbi:hypothetical protein IW256_001865 [Actinomadura viridis]|uniref:Uncharacterized protein n=1 Tax=Actinomadura viridis TaxID=58110 RepID=A0A931GI89_9ACTN|nr:hypothetical protein [Actinomadura viridis]
MIDPMFTEPFRIRYRGDRRSRAPGAHGECRRPAGRAIGQNIRDA